MCVDLTLRDGYFNGFYTVMPEDCVGLYAPDLHEVSLKNVRNLFGDVSLSQAVIVIWPSTGRQKKTLRPSEPIAVTGTSPIN